MTTPARLLRALRERLDAPVPHDPASALEQVERAANASPEMEDWVSEVRAWLQAHRAVPGTGTLVAWDRWTLTWDSHDPHLGGGLRCRTALVEDPVARRSLLRQGRQLVSLGLPIRVDHMMDRTALVTSCMPMDAHEPLSARRLGPLMQRLRALHDAGVRPHETGAALVLTEQGPALVPLAVEPADYRTAIGELLTALRPAAELQPLFTAWQAHAPGTPDEAEEELRNHLRVELVRLHHELMGLSAEQGQTGARQRLLAAVTRLGRASPPPEGRGAVGVGLNGEILVLQSTDGVVRWGARNGSLETVVTGNDLDPRGVRRLLRARAAAPTNTRLDNEVGGDPDAVEAVCRWLSTATRLRTLRLLLEKQS